MAILHQADVLFSDPQAYSTAGYRFRLFARRRLHGSNRDQEAG